MFIKVSLESSKGGHAFINTRNISMISKHPETNQAVIALASGDRYITKHSMDATEKLLIRNLSYATV